MPKAPTPADPGQGDEQQRGRRVRGKDKGARTKSRTLTNVQFELIRPFLNRMTAERIEAARQAMVEEKKFTEIAEAFGWKSRQSVDNAVGIVWREFQRYEESLAAAAAAAKAAAKKPRKADQ